MAQIVTWLFSAITWIFSEYFVKSVTKFTTISALKAAYIALIVLMLGAFTAMCVSCIGIGGVCSSAISSSSISTIEYLRFGLSLVPHEAIQCLICIFNAHFAGWLYIQSRMYAKIAFDSAVDSVKGS
jgi:hypothetical protein